MSMKRTLLSVAVLLATSSPLFASSQPVVIATPQAATPESFSANTDQASNAIMDQMAEHLRKRQADLAKWAKDPNYFFFKDGKKFLDINGYHYEIKNGHPFYPSAAIDPQDESYERNLWSVSDPKWELSGFGVDTTFVHREFGNYNWGQGCLIEVSPDYHPDKPGYLYQEQISCAAGSIGERPESGEQTLHAQYFGVIGEFANFVAIEGYRDKFIAAHSVRPHDAAYSKSLVGIYDAVTQQTVQYQGISESEAYDTLNDVRVNGSLLYVSAVSAHGRIDVFNLDTNEYYYSFAVGQQDGGKIAVNDQYILLSMPEGIAVYANEPGQFGETKAVAPLGYLAYAHGQPHAMEFVGDKLLTSSNTGSAVYDPGSLQKNVALQPMVKGLQGVEGMDANGQTIIVKENSNTTGRIAYYDIGQFIDNGYQFKEATKAAYTYDDIRWFNGTDLVLRDNDFVTMTPGKIRHIHKVDSLDFTPNTSVTETQLSFDTLESTMQAKVSNILEESASDDSIVSLVANASSMVNVRMLSSNMIEIANFTGLDLANVKLDIRARQQYTWARLATLDKLPANTRITMTLTALNADKRFNAADGSGVFNYADMLDNLQSVGNGYGHYGTIGLFDSRFATTTSDPLLERLAKISANWDIEFLNRHVFGSKEMDWTTESAERHIKLITNMAYVISSEQFKHAVMNFKEIYGQDLQVGSSVLKTEADRAKFLDITLSENAFKNVRKKEGFQNLIGVATVSGTLFGLSDQELDRVEQGDLSAFATNLAKQLKSNYFKDCAPSPCNWEERHVAKLIMDITTELRSELPYTM